MNSRQQILIRLALVYALSNLGDILEVFENLENGDFLDFNGETIKKPTEDEIEGIVKLLQ